MIVSGIIAEYHPFHKGHQFHIEETRKQTGADYVVAVMSGDYVQRGTPAILDKYTRAKMALHSGADLVIELPVISAVSSAEGFAKGGVSILHKLGIVNHVSFGCEDMNSGLDSIAMILAKEPPEYRELLTTELKKGATFPAARAKSIAGYFGDASTEIESLMQKPNNILAIEYLKTLHQLESHMNPVMIKRFGADYHDAALDDESGFSSATAIRNMLLDARAQDELEVMYPSIPPVAYELLERAAIQNLLIHYDADSSLLYYALRSGLMSDSADIRPSSAADDLKKRVAKLLETYQSRSQFTESIKSKNLTYVGVSRFLTEQLLGISSELKQIAKECNYAPYARVLGFRKDAAPLLTAIQEHSSIPVITHLAQDEEQLSDNARRLLQLDIKTADLYSRLVYEQSGILPKSEYRQSLIYV